MRCRVGIEGEYFICKERKEARVFKRMRRKIQLEDGDDIREGIGKTQPLRNYKNIVFQIHRGNFHLRFARFKCR